MNIDTYQQSTQSDDHKIDSLNEVSEWLGKHLSSRIVITSLAVFATSMGLMAALLAVQSQQDLRQSAAAPVTCAGAFTITPPTDGAYTQPTAEGKWMWSDNGPTAAWTSPATSIQTICNGEDCWLFELGKGWANGGAPKMLSEIGAGVWDRTNPPGAFLVNPLMTDGPENGWESYTNNTVRLSAGLYSWAYNRATQQLENGGNAVTDFGEVTSAWTDVSIDPATGQMKDYTNICTGSICRSWNNRTNSWRINPGYDISTNAAWQSVKAGGPNKDIMPWTEGGPRVAWTDPVNAKATICNKGWCWIYYYKEDGGGSIGFRSGEPYPICRAFSAVGADPSCNYN